MQLRLDDLRTWGYDGRGWGHCEGDQTRIYYLGLEHADGQQQWQRSQQWHPQGQQHGNLGGCYIVRSESDASWAGGSSSWGCRFPVFLRNPTALAERGRFHADSM